MRPTHSAHWLLTSLQQLLTSGTLRTLHLLSRLLGLSTVATPKPRMLGRVKGSRYWRLHGYAVFIFVLAFSPYALYIVSTRMDFIHLNRLLLIVGLHRYVLLLCTALATLYRHTTHQQRIICWINKLHAAHRQQLQLLHTTQLKVSARKLQTQDHLTLYALALSIIGSAAYSYSILVDDPVSNESYMYFCAILFFYLCQLGVQVCLALYLVAQLLISHLLHHCNLHLAQLLQDATDTHHALATRRPILHDARQHWLALELCRLWRLQCQLMQLSRCLCSLHSIQLLAFVLFAPLECVSHGFFTYFVTFSRWWWRFFGGSAPWNYFATIFIVALFGQLTLLIGQTHRQRQIFKATRHTLTKGAMALPPSCSKSLRKTLDLYGLHLQLNERVFNLTACGLFKLNKRLLFGIVQTIIIYTIILIQFDKIINT